MLRIINPAAVEDRRCQLRKRRKYGAPGPLHIAHIDGHNKVKILQLTQYTFYGFLNAMKDEMKPRS